jgi:hypothetical protein
MFLNGLIMRGKCTFYDYVVLVAIIIFIIIIVMITIIKIRRYELLQCRTTMMMIIKMIIVMQTGLLPFSPWKFCSLPHIKQPLET